MKHLSLVFILAATAFIVAPPSASPQPARGNSTRQSPPPAPQQPSPPASSKMPPPGNSSPSTAQPSSAQQVIRTETLTVRVDAVVIDKKGNYVSDLTAKDFKVLEDNKERAVTTFTRGTDPVAPGEPLQRHYIVLFFDNSSMSAGDQLQARKAAASFVTKTASPEHMMAVAEFTGALTLTQNFTANTTRLQSAVSGFKGSGTTPTPDANADAPSTEFVPPPAWGGNLNNSESDFAARTLLLALRDLSKSLAAIPGRKTLVLFTSGFPLTPDAVDQVSATIDAANKADVAIYPLDVRLTTPGAMAFPYSMPPNDDSRVSAGPDPATDIPNRDSGNSQSGAHLILAAYAPFQRIGGGRTGGGGTGGGGIGGHGTGGTGGTGGRGGTGTGGTGVRTGTPYGVPTNMQPSVLLPSVPLSIASNQQVIYMLASGTGGFPILDTNDLVGGMDRVVRELNSYYILGYAPAGDPKAGACHTISVKIDVPHTNVRSRTGYCDSKGNDVLAGVPEGAALEAQARAIPGNTGGDSSLSAQAPFFYTSGGVARVALVAQLPPNALHSLPVEKGKLAPVDVLGIVTRADGSVAARFSDSVNLEKDELNDLKKKPFDYQNSFDVAPGRYELKVVFGAGSEKLAAWEQPLAIPPYDGKSMALSPLVLGNDVQPISATSATLNAELVEDRKTLTALGFELTPSPVLRFDKKKPLGFYVEIYDPGVAHAPAARVAMIYVLIDEATGKQAYNSGGLAVTQFQAAGNPVIPVMFRLPADKLTAGKYRLDVQAADDQKLHTRVNSAHFTLE